MSDQVFEASEIPRSLWDPAHVHSRADLPKGQLRLPARLEQAYLEALHETGLIDPASNPSSRESGEIGEQGAEGARQHFATRFSGSCARIQLFALDPHQTFKTTRQALALLFSAGKVRLLDIPLGAGAGAVALLSLIAELRSEGNRILPRFDLDVQVVGGDHNSHQIVLAELVFQKLRPWWLEQGINATLETMNWDILSDEQTEDLVHLWEGGLIPRKRGLTLAFCTLCNIFRITC